MRTCQVWNDSLPNRPIYIIFAFNRLYCQQKADSSHSACALADRKTDLLKEYCLMELPSAFIEEMNSCLGTIETERLVAGIQTPAVASIRLNGRKTARVADVKTLPDCIPWTTDGRYLPERSAYTFDPLFHAGAYYVQEPSSMFVEQAVRSILSETPVKALDLCAAPGGKSTLLRSLLPEGSLLVCNEPMPLRAKILVENVQKWGHPDCVVTQNYPADFVRMADFFDLVLTDVPCSGEGMFRKDQQAVSEWSLENVRLCAERQRNILKEVWPALRPGGYLVYSTCTYNSEEDEHSVDWICRELGAEVVPIATKEDWGIACDTDREKDCLRPVYHFYPHKLRGEGFFLALLRKKGEGGMVLRKPKKERSERGKRQKDFGAVKTWIEGDDYELWQNGDGISAVRRNLMGGVKQVAENLRVLSAGTPLAEEKGKNLVPKAALAFSMILSSEAFPRVALSYKEAIAYLRGETLTLASDVPHGFVVVTYRNLPIGFVKNLGTRANNLYPAEWRIRSGHIPDEATVL